MSDRAVNRPCDAAINQLNTRRTSTMKFLNAGGLLSAVAVAACAQSVFAAPSVTWDDPVAIKSVSQIDTNGTLAQAGYWGTDPVIVQAKTESITFAPRQVLDPGTTDGKAGASGNGLATGAFSGDTGDAKFNSVLDSFDYDGNSPRVITLDGLKAGDSYEVQLFALDDRSDTGEGDRTTRFGDKTDFTGNNSKQFAEKDNVFVIGHFKADAAKVSVYQDISNNGNINAYVLRDVTAK